AGDDHAGRLASQFLEAFPPPRLELIEDGLDRHAVRVRQDDPDDDPVVREDPSSAARRLDAALEFVERRVEQLERRGVGPRWIVEEAAHPRLQVAADVPDPRAHVILPHLISSNSFAAVTISLATGAAPRAP